MIANASPSDPPAAMARHISVPVGFRPKYVPESRSRITVSPATSRATTDSGTTTRLSRVSSATIVRTGEPLLQCRRDDELIADGGAKQDALAVHEPRVAVEANAV